MKRKPMDALKSLPAFAALERVIAALAPLNPEERRKVVEAVHALLPISPGSRQEQGQPGPAPSRKKHRRR